MGNHNNKKSYLERRTRQLQQWERVIKKLILRADKLKDKNEKEIRHHILKIQVKKARTEIILRHLKNDGTEKWDENKAALEKSWLELRKAFLKASSRPK